MVVTEVRGDYGWLLGSENKEMDRVDFGGGEEVGVEGQKEERSRNIRPF